MSTKARVPAWQLWTEKEWLEQIRKLAGTLGWLCYHPHQSKFSEPGFPDLTLVRERVVFAELKRHGAAAKLSPRQEVWRDRLLDAGAEWYCWRPGDADDVVRILGRRQPGRGGCSDTMQATRSDASTSAIGNAGKGVTA